MTTGAVNLAVAQKKMRYASILRCIGQALQALSLKAVEVKTHGEAFVVQAWNRGTSMAMDVEKIYQLDEIRRMDAVAREQRKPFVEPPDLLSLSQVFRLAGNYVDRLHGRLLRVSWQDQSDKIQSITVQWEPMSAGPQSSKNSGTATIEELCIHVYKQRKKINLSSERDAHRPFVSVDRMN
ncbi:MAG: hypothetical protein EXR70_01815 [Deltaproteobacteria bacterium]|nr:hypothetical protein [Deltaproteobacteria bacterium]